MVYDAIFFEQVAILVCFALNCNAGAIKDLRVDSDAIEKLNSAPFLNRNVVPSHSIISTTTIAQQEGLAGYIDWLSELDDDILSEIFNNEMHDYVVSKSSQQGGLSSMLDLIISLFSDIHTGTPKNINVQNQIEFLLEQDPKGEYFAQNGYSPETLTYKTPSAYQNFITESLDVNITSPQQDTRVRYGETINIRVNAENSVEKLIVSIGNSAFSPDTSGKFDSNTGNFNYIATPRKLGALEIRAKGTIKGNVQKSGIVTL